MLLDAIKKMSDILDVSDPRQQSKIKYPIVPTLFGIMMAWMGGANSAVKVAEYWGIQLENLSKIIPNFPKYVISHDTVNRLLSIIMVDDLKGILQEFSQLVIDNNGYEGLGIKRILSLDGQTPKALEYEPKKGYLGHSNDDKRLHNKLYYVTLFDSTSGISLTMEEVEKKENENKACVRAIKMFDITGTVVTADALNTQRTVAEAIIDQGGDYCLALKDNHKSLRKVVEEILYNELLVNEYGQTYETETELGHGRIEKRYVTAMPINVLKSKRVLGEWSKDLNTVFLATTVSYDKKHNVARKTIERFYVSSLHMDNPNIAKLGYRAIREHWHIENKLHWCLDIDFGQDHMQIKNRNYIRNCELLSRISLNVVKEIQQLPIVKNSARQDLPSISSVMMMISCNPSKFILPIANILAYGKV